MKIKYDSSWFFEMESTAVKECPYREAGREDW